MSVNPQERKKDRAERGLPSADDDFESMGWLSSEDLEDHGSKYIAAITGWEHYNSPKKGTPGLEIRFLVVDGPCAGKQIKRTLWFSDSSDYALDILADIALSFGWDEPFSEEDDDDLEKVFTAGTGLIKLTVKEGDAWENNEGETVIPVEPAFFNSCRKTASDEVKALVKRGEAAFTGYLKWREDNPRGQGGGGNSKPKKSNAPKARKSSKKEQEADIPF